MAELIFTLICLAAVFGLAMNRADLKAWAISRRSLHPERADGSRARPFALAAFSALVTAWLARRRASVCASIPEIKRKYITLPAYRALKGAMPTISQTEQEALDAGTIGFDAELFSGKPDWEKLRAVPPITLTEEEKAFLDGPTTELCRDGQRLGDPPQRTTRSPRRSGASSRSTASSACSSPRSTAASAFPPQAQSLVLGKIASRSPDVVHHRHGAELAGAGRADREVRHARAEGPLPAAPRQGAGGAVLLADRVRPRARTPPPCATSATSRAAGTRARRSSASALSWDKRYITLAPKATLVGLAFRLFDPENILGRGEDIGITRGADPGRSSGRRNRPAPSALRRRLPERARTGASDVFIPMDWVIGGDEDGRPGLAHADGVPGRRPLDLAAVVDRPPAPSRCCATRRPMPASASSSTCRSARWRASRSRSRAWSRCAYVIEAARGVTASMVEPGEKPVGHLGAS